MNRNKQGWIGMNKICEILRLAELGQSQTAIAQSCGTSRYTVRDYLSKASVLGITFDDARKMSDEEIKSRFGKKSGGRNRKYPQPDYSRISRELLQKGVTLYLLWEEYLIENPDGYSYSQFCENYRRFRKKTSLSMRQVHRAGEKVFVDYAGQTVPIYDLKTGQELFKAQLFVAVLGASNYIFAEATASQKISDWLSSHQKAFHYFHGVPEVIVPDNLKSAVQSPSRYEPEINPAYRELAEHYDVAVIPARVRKPKDKSKAENAVQNVERRILAPLRDRKFYSLLELNKAIRPLLTALNERVMKSYGCSRKELFEKIDCPALKPLPVKSFYPTEWRKARVNIDYHVELDRHYYSVPYQLVSQEVEIKYSASTVEILYRGKRVAAHIRSVDAGYHTTEKEHMPEAHRYMLKWTPSRFLSWGESIGAETKIQINSLLLSRAHPEQSYRACLGLLSLSKKYSPERLEAACKKANFFGVVSMKRIKSMLETGTEKMSASKETVPVLTHSNIRGDTEYH